MELKQASTKAIEELVVYLKQAVDLSVEQAPSIAKEFLDWSLYSHQVGLAVGIGLVLLMCVVIAAVIKWGNSDPVWGMSTVFSICGGIVGCVMTGINIYMLIYITRAPKVYLCEYLLRLL